MSEQTHKRLATILRDVTGLEIPSSQLERERFINQQCRYRLQSQELCRQVEQSVIKLFDNGKVCETAITVAILFRALVEQEADKLGAI